MRLVDRKSVNVVVIDGDLIGGLMNSNTNAAELNILGSFIDRIDCNKKEAQTVVFSRTDVERLFGGNAVTNDTMKKKALRLGKTFKLLSSKNKNVFSIIQVFEKIAFRDGELTLTCSKAAVESIFKPELIDHFKHKLRYLPMLTGKTSCMLYLHLEDIRRENPDCSEVSVKYTIDELKRILGCDEDSYPKFSDFNQKVLKKCHSDITENTALRFDYKPADKDGRWYTAVEFTIYG